MAAKKLSFLEKIQKESLEKRERAPLLKLERRRMMKELVKKQKKDRKRREKEEKMAAKQKLNEVRKEVANVTKNTTATKEKIKPPKSVPKKTLLDRVITRKKRHQSLSDMIISFKSGGEEGFTYFFNLFYPPLLFYCVGIISDDNIAKDSISEAFIKAWERKEMFANERHLKVWIYTVARHLCYAKWKDSNKWRSDEETFEIEEEGGIDLNMIKAEVYGELYLYIEKLPTECRKILKLLYFERKTPKEICGILNIADTTVKNQKARGLNILRNMYGVTKEQYEKNEKKKIENILKSEASNATIGNRYGFSNTHICRMRTRGIKKTNAMRKIV